MSALAEGKGFGSARGMTHSTALKPRCQTAESGAGWQDRIHKSRAGELAFALVSESRKPEVSRQFWRLTKVGNYTKEFCVGSCRPMRLGDRRCAKRRLITAERYEISLRRGSA